MTSIARAALLSALLQAVSAEDDFRHQNEARAVLNVGPEGTCPAVSTAIVQLQPVFYSEYFPYNTIIDPFRNGQLFTVSNAPTTVILSSAIFSTTFVSGNNPPPPVSPTTQSQPVSPPPGSASTTTIPTTTSASPSVDSPSSSTSSSTLTQPTDSLVVAPRSSRVIQAAVFSNEPIVPMETEILSTPINLGDFIDVPASSGPPVNSSQGSPTGNPPPSNTGGAGSPSSTP